MLVDAHVVLRCRYRILFLQGRVARAWSGPRAYGRGAAVQGARHAWRRMSVPDTRVCLAEQPQSDVWAFHGPVRLLPTNRQTYRSTEVGPQPAHSSSTSHPPTEHASHRARTCSRRADRCHRHCARERPRVRGGVAGGVGPAGRGSSLAFELGSGWYAFESPSS